MKKPIRIHRFTVLAVFALGTAASQAAYAQETAKPNIVVIMGDDIGWFNIGAYHRGMMSGKTPNIDRLAREGMMFTDYYAEASCTAGRANFITGMIPMRTGMTTVGQAGSPLGLPADRVAMVGDDLEADVEGAVAAGLMAIALRTGKYTPDIEARAHEASTAVLDSLAELPGWLGIAGL